MQTVANAAVHLVVPPNDAGLADIAAFGGVDAVHVARAFAVLGVLAHGDVDAVLVNHRRSDQFVSCAATAQFVDAAFGIALEVHNSLPVSGLIGIEAAVAAGEDDLLHAADRADRGTRPLTVQNALAGADLPPLDGAGHLIDGDKAGSVGRGDDDMAFIDAVAGDDKDKVAVDVRRTGRHVVREDAQLLHHVELPDDLAGPGACRRWRR